MHFKDALSGWNPWKIISHKNENQHKWTETNENNGSKYWKFIIKNGLQTNCETKK